MWKRRKRFQEKQESNAEVCYVLCILNLSKGYILIPAPHLCCHAPNTERIPTETDSKTEVYQEIEGTSELI